MAVNNPIWDIVLRSVLLRGLESDLSSDIRLNVLDVGCGRGASTEMLLKILPNSFVTGIDLDDKQVKAAESYVQSRRAEFLVEHAAETSFDDTMFDLITEINTLHHVPSWTKAVSEAVRLLKPGGKLLITGITKKGLGNAAFRKFVAPKSLLSAEQVIKQAEYNGLTLRRSRGNSLYMRLIFQRVPVRPKIRRICF